VKIFLLITLLYNFRHELAKKSRNVIKLDIKKEIICKGESGKSAEYGIAESTISTIL